MNKEILACFTSQYTIGKSLLTCDEAEEELDNSKPVSIFTIAKKYKLDKVYLADNSFSGFITVYKSAEKAGVQLCFGYTVYVCSNIEIKDDDSTKTESKVTIWMSNSEGYKDLIKISSKAATDGFYYHPRIDWNTLQKMWTKNLSLSIDFYDGFLAKNLMVYGSSCIPNFGKIRPVFEVSRMGLPFDSVIKDSIVNYCHDDMYDTINTNLVRYYSRADFKAFIVNACIHNRTKFDKPNLNWMSSDNFCFENYCESTGIKFN